MRPQDVPAGSAFELVLTTSGSMPDWPKSVVFDPAGAFGGPFAASPTPTSKGRRLWKARVDGGLGGAGVAEVPVEIIDTHGRQDPKSDGLRVVVVLRPAFVSSSGGAAEHKACEGRERRTSWSEADRTRAEAMTAPAAASDGRPELTRSFLSGAKASGMKRMLTKHTTEGKEVTAALDLPMRFRRVIESSSTATWVHSSFASLRVAQRVAEAGMALQGPSTVLGSVRLPARGRKRKGVRSDGDAPVEAWLVQAELLAARARLSLLSQLDRQSEVVSLVRAGVDGVQVSADPGVALGYTVTGRTEEARARLVTMHQRQSLKGGARMTLIVPSRSCRGGGGAEARSFVSVTVTGVKRLPGAGDVVVRVRANGTGADDDSEPIVFDTARGQTAVIGSFVQPSFCGPLQSLHAALLSEAAKPFLHEASLPAVYAAIWRGRQQLPLAATTCRDPRSRAAGRRGVRRVRAPASAVAASAADVPDSASEPAAMLAAVETRKAELRGHDASGTRASSGGAAGGPNPEADVCEEAFRRGPTRGKPMSPRGLTGPQRRAIGAILLRPRLHAIIGPPGTGKSTTLCELLQQVLVARRAGRPDARVLFVGHSNAAVDVVVDRLLSGAAGEVPRPGEIVRWAGATHSREASLQYLGEQGARRVEGVTVGSMTPSGMKVPRVPTSEELADCTILAATVNTASRLVLAPSGAPRFSFVVVDEASTVTDGELFSLMAGACAAGCESDAAADAADDESVPDSDDDGFPDPSAGFESARTEDDLALPNDLLHASWHAAVARGSLAARAKAEGLYGHFPLGLGPDGPVGEPLLSASERPCTKLSRTRAMDRRDREPRAQFESAAPTLVLCGDPQQLNPVVKSDLATMLGMSVSGLERLTGVVKTPEEEMLAQRVAAGACSLAQSRDSDGCSDGADTLSARTGDTASTGEDGASDVASDGEPGHFRRTRRRDLHEADPVVQEAALIGLKDLLDNPAADLRADRPHYEAWAGHLARNGLTLGQIQRRWRDAAVLSSRSCPGKTLLSESFRAHPDIHWLWSVLAYGGHVRPARCVRRGPEAVSPWDAAMSAVRDQLRSMGAVAIGASEAPAGPDLQALLQQQAGDGRRDVSTPAESAPWACHIRRLLARGKALPVDIAAAAQLSWERRAESGGALPRVMVVLVPGVMRLGRGETSPTNALEAAVVQAILYAAAPMLPGGAADTGVCTPYWRQAAKVRSALEGGLAGGGSATVATVNKFQGAEVPFEVISTTRAASFRRDGRGAGDLGKASAATWQSAADAGVGFLGNPRRTNVAISRARDCLVVVGDPAILSQDEQWSLVAAYAGLCGSLWSLEPDVAREARAAAGGSA